VPMLWLYQCPHMTVQIAMNSTEKHDRQTHDFRSMRAHHTAVHMSEGLRGGAGSQDGRSLGALVLRAHCSST
jgi:hypothetical protein